MNGTTGLIGRCTIYLPDRRTLFDLPAEADLALPLTERVAGELWRGVPEYPRYFVSSKGRIWSRNERYAQGRMLRPGQHRYPSVVLYRSGEKGKKHNARAHVLMALAFFGPRPPGMLVAHKDDVKTNNVLANLKYASYSENGEDAVRNGLNNNSKLTACRRLGHPYTEENTLLRKRGNKMIRRCRACAQIDGLIAPYKQVAA